VASDNAGAVSIEIERKYDVEPEAGTPVFVGVGPIASVERPEVRELDAVYFDTADLALARAHVALRRREGGPDAGWHVKRDAGEGRIEQHWALGTVDDGLPRPRVGQGLREQDGTDGAQASVPSELRNAVRDIVDDAALVPVARVRNHRVVNRLLDAAGYPVAEFCDDHATGSNLVTGASETWREWEVELSAAAPDTRRARTALLDALEVAAFAAGGTEATSSSKLERALRAGSARS
jgi:hypothetical protein